MKVGILADIHSNSMALEAVLTSGLTHKVEKYLICGDIIGYYLWPRRVMDLLADLDCRMIRGNHEEMIGTLDHSHRDLPSAQVFIKGQDKVQEQLTVEEIERLKGLPHPLVLELEGRRILLCHGTPADASLYVYPTELEKKAACFPTEGFDLIAFGHTHYQESWSARACQVVNPGAVGQPRDRIPGACWALYDTEDGRLSLFRESYDHARLAHTIREHVPEAPYLSDVLVRESR